MNTRPALLAGLTLLLILIPLQAPAAGSGEGVTAEDYGAWSLICSPKPAERCILSQMVATDPQGRQVVLGATVVLEGNTPRLDLRFSPQAVAEAGLGIKIGDQAEYRLAMSDCSAQTCLASGWLEPPLLSQLQQAPGAQVAYMMPGGRQMLVPLSLQGFQAGLDALRQRRTGR